MSRGPGWAGRAGAAFAEQDTRREPRRQDKGGEPKGQRAGQEKSRSKEASLPKVPEREERVGQSHEGAARSGHNDKKRLEGTRTKTKRDEEQQGFKGTRTRDGASSKALRHKGKEGKSNHNARRARLRGTRKEKLE